MELRDYQSRAVEFLLPKGRGFIVAPAGSGKTVIAASAAASVAQPFDRVVWLANTREQCEQARKACAAVKWKGPVVLDVHCVAGKPDLTGADVVIVDECHHLPARTWWETVMNAECIIWGFSATPWTSDWERDGILKAFFGEENFFSVDRKEVVDAGSITKGAVVIHDLDDEGQFDAQIAIKTKAETDLRFKRHPYIPRDEHERRARWHFTAEAIRENTRRNKRIINIATEETRSVLILVSSIKHGEELAFEIDGALLVHSKLPKKERTKRIEDFRSGKLRVMIATSLADEGLDVPRAAVLILAAGGRSASKLEQRAGRVMRPHEGKEFGIVHDFADKGAGMAHNQFLARARTYKRLGYKKEAA